MSICKHYFEDPRSGAIHVKSNFGWVEVTEPAPVYTIFDGETSGKLRQDDLATSIYGDPLAKLDFRDVREIRKFTQRNPELKKSLFGTSRLAYGAVANQNYEKATIDDFTVAYFDIETECENGFPEPHLAAEAVNMITFKLRKKPTIYAFTTCDVDLAVVAATAKVDPSRIDLRIFKNESVMLWAFIKFFEEHDLDVFGGWNSKRFDLQYMMTRIAKVLGASAAERISPFGIIDSREERDDYGRKHVDYDIRGREHVDFMLLYEKRTQGSRESYSLDSIAKFELKEGKLEHESGIPGHMLYAHGLASEGLAYNIVDVLRLEGIVEKSGVLSLEITLAQMCNLNLSDTEFVTRLIIGYLYTFLRDMNLYIPFATDEKPFYKIEGGYVPDPTVGKHRYVFSVDLASSYPSSMRAVNISPELKGPMLLGPEGVMLHEDHILAGYVPEEFKSAAFREKYTMAPNGATFLREKRGILPLMLDELYARRKQLKAEYLRLSKLAAEAPEGKIKDDLETQASAAKNADLAVKLILNSTYGALASDKFLFFDPDVAGAVTSTGRIALKRMGEYVMQLVNSRVAMLKSLSGYCKKFGIDRASVAPPDELFPEFKGVFVAGDTDSNYVSVAPFIEHLTFSSDPTENEKGRLDFLVWFGDNIVQQSIDKAMQQVERDVNALVTGVIKADREIVSPAGIWVAKKKYSALVYDQEGAKYWPEFKNKTQGLTLIQGRTTEQVKEVLKAFMKLLLLNTPEEANQHLISHRDLFYELDPDSIAINASANGFEKYVDEDGFAKKVKSPETGKLQSPTQEGRAAINFNRLVRKHQKEETYGTLQDGARFRFVHLRLPNPVNDSVVGWPDEWPKLFEDIGLEKYIFRSRQFDKAVMGQCNALFKVMGFNPRIAEQLDLV